MTVRVRLAPSPTGLLHVGTARTALFNFLFARHHGGKFLLRIEDTDRERSKPEYEKELLDGLQWLGVSWDEGPDVGGPHAPYRQSERTAQYRAALEQLLREGKAYERPRTTLGAGQGGAIVLRVEPREVIIHDLVRGDVRFPAEEQQDFVLARELDDPLFHLAVVVDDAAMEITHVIRGEDHLSNTPRHILLQRALGLPMPQYAHVPLLLDAERKKLSKRTTETGLRAYRDRGYLPEAMVNFLALLGWNPKSAEEIFALTDLAKRFDLAGVQKGGAIFDLKKLDWLQRQHLQRMNVEALVERARPFAGNYSVRNFRNSLEVWRDHGLLLHELPDALAMEDQPPVLAREDVPWRGVSEEKTREALRFAEEMIEKLPRGAWETPKGLQTAFRDAVDAAGWDRGTVLWPVRYALSGRRESPGPGELAWVLGVEETVRRIRRGREVLEQA